MKKDLNKDDLRNYNKGRKNTTLDLDIFCRGLEYAGRTHKQGYFHYTKWSSFVKMSRPVRVSDSDAPCHVIVTKAPNDKNDLTEGNLDRRYWYVSFTYLPHEVVSMWIVYGKYSQEAVRLQFSAKSVQKWAAQDVRNIKIYQVPEDEGDTYNLINAKVKSVALLDIGYYAKYSQEIGKREGVIHRHRKYNVKMPKNGIAGLNGDDKKYAAYLKEAMWMGEQEVRLLLEFDHAVECDKIAIAFDEPIKDLVKQAKNHVVTSPWMNVESADGISICDCAVSTCCGKIAAY